MVGARRAKCSVPETQDGYSRLTALRKPDGRELVLVEMVPEMVSVDSYLGEEAIDVLGSERHRRP